MSFDNAFLRFPIIETERTILREFNLEKDPAAHLEIFNDTEVYEFFDNFPKNITEAENGIRSTHKAFLEKRAIRWCITLKEDTSKTIGNIVLASFTMKSMCEIGYLLTKKHWRKGLMTEVMGAILKFGFLEMDLHRIHAIILPGNISSVKLLSKFNFTEEGYLRKYSYIPIRNNFQDSVMYSLLKDDFSN